MKPRKVSEDEQLTDYVLDYYAHFANRFEQDLMLALGLNFKQIHSESPLMRHKLGDKRDEIIARIADPGWAIGLGSGFSITARPQLPLG